MPKLYKNPVNTFDYDDVILVPGKNIIQSRSEVNTKTKIGNHVFNLPVVPANMSTIVDENTCIWLAERGFFYVMHRFDINPIEFTQRMHEKGLISSISLGIREADFKTVDEFQALNLTPEYITVDVAHGDSDQVFKIIGHIKKMLPQSYVIAGNVATTEGATRLAEAGADAVKIGVGPGCYAAGTKVLMADSSYKNIEDIKIGDRVINKEGKPVNVKGTRNSGLRMVQRFKHTNWYTDSYATGDHRHFGIDMQGLRPTSLDDEGYAKIASKNRKVAGFPSRMQWMELEDENLGALLFPRRVSFELPEDFEINLGAFSKNSSSLKNMNEIIKPSYDLGYIFGTFLGDGNARISNKKGESASVKWAFGINEEATALKLEGAIERVAGKQASRVQSGKENLIIVSLYSTIWGRFLNSFGKFNNKHLPQDLMCSDRKYLQGIYDGLIDSDGHIEQDGRTAFTNTSPKLIELMSILTLILKGVVPNQAPHNVNNPQGGLKGVINVDNFKKSFRTRLNTSYLNRLTDDFYCVKITSPPVQHAIVETYDIEVDDVTQSFIANNVIVHNSACLTAPNTGFGSQHHQLSTVAQVAETLETSHPNVQIVADGGIRHYGDIAKSIAFGAHLVMIGGMLAGHDENPGDILDIDGEKKKAFFGSASEHQKGEKKHVEGKLMYMPYKGSLEDTMRTIKENLQSSVSYAGGRELQDLRNVSYVRLSK